MAAVRASAADRDAEISAAECVAEAACIEGPMRIPLADQADLDRPAYVPERRAVRLVRRGV